MGLGLVSPSRALIREMSLVNVWYEGWMVGARPPVGGCIIASPPISFKSVASRRARRLDIFCIAGGIAGVVLLLVPLVALYTRFVRDMSAA